jgi:hypothetical protein
MRNALGDKGTGARRLKLSVSRTRRDRRIRLHSSTSPHHGSTNLHPSSLGLHLNSTDPRRSSTNLHRSSLGLRRSSIDPHRRYLRRAPAVAPAALALDSVAVLPMGVAAPAVASAALEAPAAALPMGVAALAAAEIIADGISVTGYSTSKLWQLRCLPSRVSFGVE